MSQTHTAGAALEVGVSNCRKTPSFLTWPKVKESNRTSFVMLKFMRAARLLKILLMLQNRGQLTAAQLALELEVDRRTVLRDVDALSEAGLPIVTVQGHGGGIQLGFNYRTRLTGLDDDEAEAVALILTLMPKDALDLGLGQALTRAQAKLRASFPEKTQDRMTSLQGRFLSVANHAPRPDPRRAAMAAAVRQGCVVTLQAQGPSQVQVYPVALELQMPDWVLCCATGRRFLEPDWGDVNVSARRFDPHDPTAT